MPLLTTFKKIKTAIRVASELCGRICNIVIIFINAFIFYEVIVRYVFNSPTIWVNETCLYLLPTLCFVGASYCLKHKGHIRVDFFVRRYSKRTGNLLDALVSGASFLFFAVLGWEAYVDWHEAYVLNFTSGTIFDIPLWIPYIVFPIGMIFLCLQFIIEFSDNLTEFFKY